MDAEQARAYLLRLPNVVETMQWGDNLLFWVGDKAIGGKMFVLLNLDGEGKAVTSFAAGAERFADLVEREGLFPAPYMARIFWVAAQRWDVMLRSEWEAEFAAAHTLTSAKLPARTRTILAMPPAERRKLVAERKRLLAAKLAASTVSAKPRKDHVPKPSQARLQPRGGL